MWWILFFLAVIIVGYFSFHVIIHFIAMKKVGKDQGKREQLASSKISKQEKEEIINKYQRSGRIKQTYAESYSASDNHYRDLFLTLITDNTVILDTETTGLDEKAEIIEISIIDMNSNVLLDTLIKPKRRIPQSAIDIHGITNEMVKDAPSWEDVYPTFRKIVKSSDSVLIYNEKYDKRLIMQTCKLANVPTPQFNSDCMMKLCAAWYGEKKQDGEYLYKSLSFIAKARKINIQGSSHRALTDCNTVRDIINSFIK